MLAVSRRLLPAARWWPRSTVPRRVRPENEIVGGLLMAAAGYGLLRVLGGWPAGRWTRPGTRRCRQFLLQRADRGRGPAHPLPAGVQWERPLGRVEVCGQQAPAGLGRPVHLAERRLPLERR